MERGRPARIFGTHPAFPFQSLLITPGLPPKGKRGACLVTGDQDRQNLPVILRMCITQAGCLWILGCVPPPCRYTLA